MGKSKKWALSVTLKFTSHVFTFEERSICLTSHLLPAIPPHSYVRSLQELQNTTWFPFTLLVSNWVLQSSPLLQSLFSTLPLAITTLNPSVWLFRTWALPTWLLSLYHPVSEYCLLIRQFSVICWEYSHFWLWASASDLPLAKNPIFKKTLFKKNFWLHHVACRILVPWPGIKLVPSVFREHSLNYWTAREVLKPIFLLLCALSNSHPLLWLRWSFIFIRKSSSHNSQSPLPIPPTS